jgi:TIR domain
MKGKIFICYRREDDGYAAQRIHAELAKKFGSKRLFIDTSGLLPGLNFISALERELAHASVLLAVIGPSWLNTKDQEGTRRLDNPTDFVRTEISAALKRNIPVIPLCLDGALVPKDNQLPEDIRELARRGAIFVRLESFDADVARLIRATADLLALNERPRRAISFPVAATALAGAVAALGLAAYLNGGSPQTSRTNIPISATSSKDQRNIENDKRAAAVEPLEPASAQAALGPVPPWLQTMRDIKGTRWSPSDGNASGAIKEWHEFIAKKYPDMAKEVTAKERIGYYSWPGLPVAYAMAKAGVRPPFSDIYNDTFFWSRAWLNWGTVVTDPQPGDVLVIILENGDNYVALFERKRAETVPYPYQAEWVALGKTPTHEVNEWTVKRDQIVGIRRPPVLPPKDAIGVPTSK